MLINLISNLSILAAETADAAHGAEESAEGISALGIDPTAILLQGATFLVLFFFFNKYGLNVVVKNLKDRRDKINEGLDNAELIEKEIVEVKQKNEELAKAARKEADDVINKSHEEAGAILNEAQTKAQTEATEIVNRAKSQAEAEAEKVKSDLTSELSSLVAKATEVILNEKLDSDKDKELTRKAIKEVLNS